MPSPACAAGLASASGAIIAQAVSKREPVRRGCAGRYPVAFQARTDADLQHFLEKPPRGAERHPARPGLLLLASWTPCTQRVSANRRIRGARLGHRLVSGA